MQGHKRSPAACDKSMQLKRTRKSSWLRVSAWFCGGISLLSVLVPILVKVWEPTAMMACDSASVLTRMSNTALLFFLFNGVCLSPGDAKHSP